MSVIGPDSLLGPEGRRLFEFQATRRRGGDLASGVAYVVYLDEAGTNLADIADTSSGSSIPGSTVVTADIAGLGPSSARFWGPTTQEDVLWLRCPSDPTLGVQKLESETDPRLDALEAVIGGVEAGVFARRDEANTFTAVNTFTGDAVFRSGRPWVDVKGEGATGDGTTNDTAAFNAARVAAGTYGQVIVPEGVYIVDQVELSVAGQRWELLPGAVVKLATGAGSGHAAFHVLANGVTILGPGTVDGNGAAQANGTHGIRTAFADTLIDGVTIQNVKANGVVSYGGTRLVIRNCKISTALTDGPIFVRPDSSGAADLNGVVVEGCFIDQSAVSAATVAGAGIKLIGYNAGAQVNDSRIISNRVVMPASPTGVAIAVEANFAPRVVVAANTVFGGSMGISVVQAAGGVIDGNTVKGAEGYGIESGCAQGSVTGNTVDMSSIAGSVGIQLVTNGNDCAVVGNTIVSAIAGIQVQACVRVPIVGNMVRAFGTNAIYLAAADGATVAGNVLDGGGSCDIAISVDTCSDLAIDGNTIRNFDVKGIELYAASVYAVEHITITGNIFRSVGTVLSSVLSGGAFLSSTIRATGNTGLTDYLDFGAAVVRAFGAGTPEGAVTAGVGSTFQRTDGGAGTIVYAKNSGTGNTGWGALT